MTCPAAKRVVAPRVEGRRSARQGAGAPGQGVGAHGREVEAASRACSSDQSANTSPNTPAARSWSCALT